MCNNNKVESNVTPRSIPLVILIALVLLILCYVCRRVRSKRDERLPYMHHNCFSDLKLSLTAF